VDSIVGLIISEKSPSTLCRKTWVFSGCLSLPHEGKLTGWVRINTVKKVISQLLYKDKIVVVDHLDLRIQTGVVPLQDPDIHRSNELPTN
jgi:hypothetical protein